MLTLIGLITALFVGGFFGWKLTAKNERMLGYADAVDDQFKRLRQRDGDPPLRLYLPRRPQTLFGPPKPLKDAKLKVVR